ncbi:hypothetical protein IAU59_001398 [Kwoniella sp. CBS 9459]
MSSFINSPYQFQGLPASDPFFAVAPSFVPDPEFDLDKELKALNESAWGQQAPLPTPPPSTSPSRLLLTPEQQEAIDWAIREGYLDSPQGAGSGDHPSAGAQVSSGLASSSLPAAPEIPLFDFFTPMSVLVSENAPALALNAGFSLPTSGAPVATFPPLPAAAPTAVQALLPAPAESSVAPLPPPTTPAGVVNGSNGQGQVPRRPKKTKKVAPARKPNYQMRGKYYAVNQSVEKAPPFGKTPLDLGAERGPEGKPTRGMKRGRSGGDDEGGSPSRPQG